MANGTGRRGMVSATVVSWPHSPPLPLFQSQSVGVLQRVYIHAEIFSEFWVQQGDVGCKQSYQNVQWISSSARHDKWCWLWTELPKFSVNFKFSKAGQVMLVINRVTKNVQWIPQSLLPFYSLLTFQFQCRIYPFLFPHIILVTIGKPQTTQMHTMQILTVQNQPSLIYKYCST